MLERIKKEINSFKSKERAKINSYFFKTGKGEYAEKDKFLGVRVPVLRKIAKKYKEISLKDIECLLMSEIHEYRFIALVFLINKYKKERLNQEKIFNFYIKNAKYIDNWDLVDISAPHIFGDYLLSKNKEILYNFLKSHNLWRRRIAIVSCFAFIKNNDFKDIIKIAKISLNDKHDLIHKACGWMLRELGKRDKSKLRKFLDQYYQKMPRVCLRYALERMSQREKEKYMKK